MSDQPAQETPRDTTPGLFRRWVMRLVFLIVGLIVGVGIIGTQLAPGYGSSAERGFADLPPAELWSLLQDYETFPMTSGPVIRVVKRADVNGLPSWEEQIRGATIVVTTEALEPPVRLVRTLADQDSPMTTRWTFEITPSESGSKLAITEQGQIPGGSWVSPWLRIMVRLSPGWGIRDLLDRLEARNAGPPSASGK